MGAIDGLSKASKILRRRLLEMSEKESAEQLAKASKMREAPISGTTEAINNERWQLLKSKDNERLGKEATRHNKDIKATNLMDEEYSRFTAPELTEAERVDRIKRIDTDMELRQYDQNMKAEKEARIAKPKFAQPNESTKILDTEPTKFSSTAAAASDTTATIPTTKPNKKASAILAAPLGVSSAGFSNAGFTNPMDVLKHGYEKAKQVKQSVVDKIVDLTDAGLSENPYVPQYAKDHYNKAADALVSNVTDPTSYIGGMGAANAVTGAASTGYDAYMGKPQSTYVDNAPKANVAQSFKVKP